MCYRFPKSRPYRIDQGILVDGPMLPRYGKAILVKVRRGSETQAIFVVVAVVVVADEEGVWPIVKAVPCDTTKSQFQYWAQAAVMGVTWCTSSVRSLMLSESSSVASS